jgi:drug/metabolite transporter (DMT)-like permease
MSVGYVCVAMVLWPVIESVPHFMSRSYSAYQVVWTRYTAHLILLLILFVPRQRKQLFYTPRPGWQIIRSLTMLGMPACYIAARARMSGAAVMTVFWIAPVLVMVLAGVWLHERVGWRYWLLTLLAYGGSMLILPTANLTWAGTLLAIGMAVFFALYLVLSRRLRAENIWASLFYTALGVWVPLSLGLPFFWQAPTLGDVAWMSVIGVLGLVVLFALDRAVDLMQASRVAPFIFMLPITLGWGGWLVGITPGTLALVGAVLIVGSGLGLLYLNTREAIDE